MFFQVFIKVCANSSKYVGSGQGSIGIHQRIQASLESQPWNTSTPQTVSKVLVNAENVLD
ncbi:hypothetical protein T08_6897 [Trichinella sp. T8]|nr:hypothetical protein T08_6897 [Trichinella sp. T8]